MKAARHKRVHTIEFHSKKGNPVIAKRKSGVAWSPERRKTAYKKDIRKPGVMGIFYKSTVVFTWIYTVVKTH